MIPVHAFAFFIADKIALQYDPDFIVRRQISLWREAQSEYETILRLKLTAGVTGFREISRLNIAGYLAPRTQRIVGVETPHQDEEAVVAVGSNEVITVHGFVKSNQ